MDQGLLNVAFEAAVTAGKKILEYYAQEIDVLVKQDNSPLTLADLESNKIINQFLVKTGIPVLSEENRVIPYEERKKWKNFWLVDPLDGTKEFIKKSTEFTVNIALIEKGEPVMGVVCVPAQKKVYYGSRETGSYKAFLDDDHTNSDFKKIRKNKLDPVNELNKPFVIVASRSHMAPQTAKFIEKFRKQFPGTELSSFGSSLKLCMVAEGAAAVYPRLGPTMEWDIAASHAVVESAGCKILRFPDFHPLVYNKEDLHNPAFIVYNPSFDNVIKKIV